MSERTIDLETITKNTSDMEKELMVARPEETKEDSKIEKYSASVNKFVALHKDNQKNLLDFIEGRLDFAEDCYNTEDAYNTTKSYIEQFAGGRNTEKVGDTSLKDVYAKAMAKLEGLRKGAIEKQKEPADNAQDDKQTVAAITRDEQLYAEFMEVASGANYLLDANGAILKGKEAEFDNYIQDFIKIKNEYLATKTPEESKKIEDKLEGYLNNNPDNELIYGDELFLVSGAFKEHYKKIDKETTRDKGQKEAEDTKKLVPQKEEREVPNLVHVLTHRGFNNHKVIEKLNTSLKNAKDDRTKGMYQAILDAYTADDKTRKDKVSKLNDLIKEEKDIAIAEAVARDFGYDEKYDFAPKMKKEVITGYVDKGIAEDTKKLVPQKEEREVPNLVHVLTHRGFNNHKVIEKLNTSLKNAKDDRTKGMYQAILDAYTADDKTRKDKVSKLNDLIKEEKDIAVAEGVARDFGYDEKYDFAPKMKKEVITGYVETIIPVLGEHEETHTDTITKSKDVRRREPDNFDNSLNLCKIELEVLHNRELITDDEYKNSLDALDKAAKMKNSADLTKQQEIDLSSNMLAQEKLAEAMAVVDKGQEKIAEKDVVAYRDEVAENILTKYKNGQEDVAELLTPEILAQAIRSNMNKADKAKTDEDKQKAEEYLQTAIKIADGLTSDLSKMQGYFYTDITNVADIYDGYQHMFDACEEYAKKQNTSTDAYKKGRELMDEYIKPYDTLYNIPGKDNPVSKSKKLNDRFKEADKIFDEITDFNEDSLGKDGHAYLEAMSHFKFIKEYDANKNPVYEDCVIKDKDGKLSVVKGSSLDTALRFAANQALMENLGNFDTEISKEMLMEGAKDNAFNTLFAYANAEDVVKKGLKEDPNRFTDKKFLQEFQNKLMQGEDMELSPLATRLALNRQANNIEVYGNRLSSQLGKENTAFIKEGLNKQIARIDKNSVHKGNLDAVKNKALKRQLLGIGIGSAISFGAGWATAGLFNAPTAAGLTFGQEIIRGGPLALGCAVGGAAVSTLAYFGMKKITAMIKKQKYGWKDVKQDLKSPAFKTAVISGALGGASAGFALSGCPMCAAGFGIGAVGIAGIGRGYATYRDMRLSGHGKTASFAMGALNAIAVAGAAKLGNMLGSNGLEATTDTRTASKDEFAGLKDMSDADLSKAGWTKEVTDPYNNITPEQVRALNGDDYYLYSEETSVFRDYHGAGEAAKDRVTQWVDADKLTQLHDDAISKGITEDAFWRYMNNSILAQKNGVPTEFGTHNSYITTVQKGADFTTAPDYASASSDNHFMYSREIIDKLGITQDDVSKMASFVNWKEGTINDSVLATMKTMDAHLTADGAINTSTDDLMHLNLKSSYHNASYDASAGELVGKSAGGQTTYTSVHKDDLAYVDVNNTTSIFAKFTQTFKVDPVAAMGTLLYDGVNKVKNFFRPGAKADRIVKDEYIETKPITETKKPVKPIPVPPVPIKDEGKDKDEVGVVEKKPEQKKPEQVKPVAVLPVISDETKKLLMEEYDIVKGKSAGEEHYLNKNEKELKRYLGLVRKEQQADKDYADKPLRAYLQHRLDGFYKELDSHNNTSLAEINKRKVILKQRIKDPDKLKDSEKWLLINYARNEMYKSEISAENVDGVKEKGTKNVTLTHFKEVLGLVYGNRTELWKSRTEEKGPITGDEKDKHNRTVKTKDGKGKCSQGKPSDLGDAIAQKIANKRTK